MDNSCNRYRNAKNESNVREKIVDELVLDLVIHANVEGAAIACCDSVPSCRGKKYLWANNPRQLLKVNHITKIIALP